MTGEKYKPKCVLFDADGVIINTGEQMSQKYARKFGIGASELIEFFSGPFSKCLVGKADLKDEIKPYLNKLGWGCGMDEFLAWWFDAEHNIDKRVDSAIERLKKNGVPVYLATNQERYRGEYMKSEMGFIKKFDKVFISAEIGYKKPDRDFFNVVLNHIKNDCGARPEEVIFFDDSKSHILVAKKSGIKAHLYKDFERDMLPVLARYWKVFRIEDWAILKRGIDAKKVNEQHFFHPCDVLWCNLGQNIGSELSGKGLEYSCPVVILNKICLNTALIVPLTTSASKHYTRVDISDFGGKKSKAIVSQIRVVDTKRLSRKIGKIDYKSLNKIRKVAKGFL